MRARLACVLGLILALALAEQASAEGVLIPESPALGIEQGTPVDGFRTDGVVRFDPLAPRAEFAGDAQSEDDGGTVYDYAVPIGGDVSGDGLEDVLQVHAEFDRDGAPLRSMLEARRGSDGASLWRAELGAGVSWGGYLPGDTTGDHRPDLVFVTLEDVEVVVLWPPPGLSCFDCLKYVLTGTTRLRLLDGASGSWRWEHAQPVTFTFSEQPVFGILLRAWAATNLLAAFSAAGDVDGDGGRDLLWTPWEATYTGVKSTQTALVRAYQGARGTELWTLPVAGGGTTPWNHSLEALAGAWPGPDGTGDGIPDVYTSEIEETAPLTTLTRRGIDGRTGEAFWEQGRQWQSDQRLLDGAYLPLAGGGLVYRLTGNDFRSDVEALDPATGAVGWQQLSAPALFVLPGGDLDRDRLDDLFYFGFDPADASATLTGIDGETGAAISQRRFSLQGWRSFYLMSPFLDHSGDGAVDVVHGASRTSAGGIEEWWSLTSLADGSELWDLERSAPSGVTYLVPASNLDGRRAHDILLARFYDAFGEPDPRIDLAGLRGESGRRIWSRDAYRRGEPGETIWQASLGFMRDANGRRGHELLFSSINVWDFFFAGELSIEADLIDGKRGATYLRLIG